MNFPFLLGNCHCHLSFVGWKLCMKSNEMTYNGLALQARVHSGQESSPSQQRNSDHDQRVAHGGHMIPP